MVRALIELDKLPGSRLDGPLLYFDTFRPWLKTRPPECPPKNFFLGGDGPEIQILQLIPMNVWRWFMEGKRVFHVQGDVNPLTFKSELENAPLESLDWPLDAFAVTFGEPIPIPGFDERVIGVICSILYFEGADSPVLLMHAVLESIHEFDVLDSDEIERLSAPVASMKRAGNEEMKFLTVKLLKSGIDIDESLIVIQRPRIFSIWRFLVALDERRLGEVAERSSPSGILLRAIAHLCRSLVVGGTVLSSQNRCSVLARDSQNALAFDPIEVAGSSVFDPRLKMSPTSSGRGGYTVKPHRRGGYYRRPRGSPVSAPKTEWVNPTFIHRELIEAGVDVAGTEMTIRPKSPEDDRS